MIIELIGAPGAGKTTLLPTVITFFRERGMAAFTVVDAARPYAKRTIWGSAVCWLAPRALRRPLLWQVFYRLGVFYRLKFWMRHPRLMWWVLATQRRRPAAAEVRRRKVLYWFFHLIGYSEFLKAKAQPNEVLVFDEGFVHRVVQLHTSSVEKPDGTQISTYLDLLPAPDLVIFVRARQETCTNRIYSRGLWERASHKNPDEISQFVDNAHRAVNLAVERARSKDWIVIEVNNDSDDLAAAKADLHSQLAQILLFTGDNLGLQAA